jgi:glucose dehydrogenase
MNAYSATAEAENCFAANYRGRSSLNEIKRENAGRLKVPCTYDTNQHTGFNSGLLMVDGALLFATEHDTYSIDPITCREKWHKAMPQNN